MKVAYLKHPVSPEKKAEYRDKGFRILDIAFVPEKPGAKDFVEGVETAKKRGRPAKKAEGDE